MSKIIQGYSCDGPHCNNMVTGQNPKAVHLQKLQLSTASAGFSLFDELESDDDYDHSRDQNLTFPIQTTLEPKDAYFCCGRCLTDYIDDAIEKQEKLSSKPKKEGNKTVKTKQATKTCDYCAIKSEDVKRYRAINGNRKTMLLCSDCYENR